MEKESAEAFRAALAVVSTERDQLRLALDEASRDMERLRAEAQAGSKVKADFLARMTHELRTPLSAIIGLANLAAPEAGNPRLADYLARIRESARGLLEVVDDITDFSRLEKGEVDLAPVPFDLSAALARVSGRFLGPAREKGLRLTTRLDPCAPVRLVGDHARLEGILGHLVGNAVKFTEKGSVDVVVDCLSREDGLVRLVFAVHDTGIGMVQADIPAMLESFTQADGTLSRPYGGTGLGLALVSRGVALLGGTLSVESAPGRGTRFSFEAGFAEDAIAGLAEASGLSVCPESPPQRMAIPAAAAAGRVGSESRPLGGVLILLVEDNPINQQVAREILERLGAGVDVAQHGREAVEMAPLTFYDVVLMDVQMPVMDGLEATRRIRALPGGADLPIVALTAHALDEDRDRCLEAGMNDYLTKPLDVDRLLSSLGQWIASAAAAAKPGRARAARTEWPDVRPEPPAAPAPGLDAAAALARLGGNERLLLSVAAEFVRDYAASAARIESRIQTGNLEEARRLAHTVKGVAGNLAAGALAAAARDLEAALAAGSQPHASLLDAFRETLAAAVAAASKLSPPQPAVPACAKSGCWRVLVVDDAKLNRAIVSQILRSVGHEVVTAADGKQACRVLFGENNAGRPFDAILMDIEMPEMDGPTAARIIRGLLAASVNPPCPAGIPIIALTSHDAAEERARCLDAGMDECLHKVLEHNALLSALERIIGGEAKARLSSCPQPTGGAAAALTPLLRCLAGHLAEGNIRADEDMAVLREAFVGRPAPPEMAELSQAVEHFEFSAALAIMRRMAGSLGIDPGEVVRRSV